jgi:hypothetical protein
MLTKALGRASCVDVNICVTIKTKESCVRGWNSESTEFIEETVVLIIEHLEKERYFKSLTLLSSPP